MTKPLPFWIAAPLFLVVLAVDAIRQWLFPPPMCAQPNCRFVGGPNRCKTAREISAEQHSQERK